MTAELAHRRADADPGAAGRCGCRCTRDTRGWFKENWQREKMTALGLPDFGPVQNNVVLQRAPRRHPGHPRRAVGQAGLGGDRAGLRRLGGPARGRRLSARSSPSRWTRASRCSCRAASPTATRRSRTARRTPTWSTTTGARASPTRRWTSATPTLAIPWPIPLAEAEISEKDRANPRLGDVEPGAAAADAGARRRRAARPGAARRVPRRRRSVEPRRARPHRRRRRWRPGPGRVRRGDQRRRVHRGGRGRDPRRAPAPPGRSTRRLPRRSPASPPSTAVTLVHFSTDYVFDGTPDEHTRTSRSHRWGCTARPRPPATSPCGGAPAHYLLRTSLGGRRRAATSSARCSGWPPRAASPAVVDDQVGRLTFADELARATAHLLRAEAPFGTYNVTNGGPPTSWADIAREVFALCGRSRDDVTRDHHGGVRRRQDRCAPPAAQHAGPGPARGDRVHARGRAGCADPPPHPRLIRPLPGRAEVGADRFSPGSSAPRDRAAIPSLE